MHAMPEFNTAAELRAHYARVFKRRPSNPVPKEIQENPARSDHSLDKPALKSTLAGAGTCGVASIKPVEWVSLQDVIATPVVRLIRTDQPKIEEIQRATAEHYGVTRDDIISSRRTLSIVRPRQVAVYLAKVLTLRSLPDIGRRFGNRDHTTVLHSVRKIANLVQSDALLAADIAAVRLLLGVESGRAAG